MNMEIIGDHDPGANLSLKYLFSRNQKIAIKNFFDMLKPGGILIIDHRNYDYILTHGKSPNKNIYYNSSIYKVVTKTIYEDGKAKQIILDYRKKGEEDGNFLLHVQPYLLEEFSSLLKVRGFIRMFQKHSSLYKFSFPGSIWLRSQPQSLWRLQGAEGEPRPRLLHPHD